MNEVCALPVDTSSFLLFQNILIKYYQTASPSHHVALRTLHEDKNGEDEKLLWQYLIEFYQNVNLQLLETDNIQRNDFFPSSAPATDGLNPVPTTPPTTHNPDLNINNYQTLEDQIRFQYHCSLIVLEFFAHSFLQSRYQIHESISSSMLFSFLKSFLPILLKLSTLVELDLSEELTQEISSTSHEILFQSGTIIIRYLVLHCHHLLQDILLDSHFIHDIFSFPNHYRINLTLNLLSPCCTYPSLHFSNDLIHFLIKNRIFEKLLSYLETVTNCYNGSKVLEILACLVSSCLSTGDHNLEPYTYPIIQSGNREDILSIICSFEVNGILLNVAKLCIQLSINDIQTSNTTATSTTTSTSTSTVLFDRIVNSLLYLTLCKDSTICYSKISEIFQYLSRNNLDFILSHYDYLSSNAKEPIKTSSPSITSRRECTEIAQVFIDIIPRIMGLRSNAKRKSLSGIESPTEAIEDQFFNSSRHYLVSYLRILSTLIAGHVEVRGRSLAKRLPLGSIAYSSLDDFDVILFDEFCRSMGVAVLSCLPTQNSTSEGGKHLDPQLVHVCMHSGSLLSRHPEFSSSYLMLATTVLLTKDPHKFRILIEAKILDFCLVIMTTPSFSHEGNRYSQLIRATFQFLSTLIICYPTFITSLVLDSRYQLFLFNSFSYFFTNLQFDINDFCCLLQFWLTFFLASETFLSSTFKNYHTLSDDQQQHKQKITESLMQLVWIIFAALSTYPKKSSFGSIDNHDCCVLLTLRFLRIIFLSLESGGKIWSTQLLKKTICLTAINVRQWLESSPQSVINSCLTELLMRNTQWIQPLTHHQGQVTFVNSQELELFLTSMTSHIHETAASVSVSSPSHAPSWVRSMSLAILMNNLIEFSFELFHFSFVINSSNISNFNLVKVTCREIFDLSLCFCCDPPALSHSPRLSSTGNTTSTLTKNTNMELFLLKNLNFISDIDWNSDLVTLILNSKLEWYQSIYESCIVLNSHGPTAPELFVCWVELALNTIHNLLNYDKSDTSIPVGGDYLYKWINILCLILDDVIDWFQSESSIPLSLAYTNLSLTLLHSHLQLFYSSENLLHEIFFPEELGNVAATVSEKILNTVSCLCGLHMSNDTLCCILEIMNSTVTMPNEYLPNLPLDPRSLSQASYDYSTPSRNNSFDRFEKSSSYYGVNSEMIRRWGYSVILAVPDQSSETNDHRATHGKNFLARMKTMELPSALYSPRKFSRENHPVQLKEHLASPAWCHIRLSNSSDRREKIAMVTAKHALSESHESTSSSESSEFNSWIPVSSGYTISVWFSIKCKTSLTSADTCSSERKCTHHAHYILCQIEGSESSYWPTLTLYVCNGRVLLSVQNMETSILFEPLLHINYDGRWHHLVIRHHTNRSRPFIMATLDGLPSQEYGLNIAPNLKNTKKSHRYSLSSFITIPDDHPPANCTLALGPLLLVRRPLNTAQVIALFGAGPHYSGIFTRMMTLLPAGEGGEIPLSLSYCSNVLAEASLKAQTNRIKSRSLNSLPGVMHGSVFTDPDLSPEHVMFAASTKWIYPRSNLFHSENSKFQLTGREMLSDINTFTLLLQQIRQNFDNSHLHSSRSRYFVYTPDSNSSSSSSSPLTITGDVILANQSTPSLSDHTTSIYNILYLQRSALRLLLTSNGSHEVEYAIRLCIFFLTSFPSTTEKYGTEVHLHILLDLIRQKISSGTSSGTGNTTSSNMDRFAPILSLIAACPSKIQKSNNMKVLWYGSSIDEEEDQDDDEETEIVPLVDHPTSATSTGPGATSRSSDSYMDGILTNRELMLSSDAILVHPYILRRIIQFLLFQSHVNSKNLQKFLNKILTSQLHPISRFTQINRYQFISSSNLRNILYSLTYPNLSSEKIIITCEFLMKLIESDIGIFEDYQAIFTFLLILSTHSKSISIRFLTLYLLDDKGKSQTTSTRHDQYPFPSIPCLEEEDHHHLEEKMHDYSLLKQNLFLVLLQAVNGFYATTTACRKDENISFENHRESPTATGHGPTSGPGPSTSTSTGNSNHDTRDILLSVLKDTGDKSLETIVSAISLNQLLYLLNRSLSLILLHTPDKAIQSRLILLNPKSFQDYKSGVLCLLIFSCVVQVHFSTGEISASLLQQMILELELYLPPLFFVIIFSSILEGDKNHELKNLSSPLRRVPSLNLSTTGQSSTSTPTSTPTSTLPIRLTSIIYGNKFLEFDDFERNLNTSSSTSSSPNLKTNPSASSVLSNIKNTYQYFSSYRAGINAIQGRESGYWLSKFIEGIFDIAMGAPGTLRQNLMDLLMGWSLSELEPKYTLPTSTTTISSLPDLKFEPSPHGMCIGISTLMNVIIDAARFSTACSLMFLSTVVAVDEAAPPPPTATTTPYDKEKFHIPSVYLRSWTENELSHASNTSRSTCLTLLCCLFSLLQRSPTFRKFLFQPSPTKTHWATQSNLDTNKKRNKKFQKYTLMDVFLLGLIHTYFASSKARFMECLGSRSKIDDGLASFDAGVQVPYEFIYVCTLTSIGHLILQILTFITTSEYFEILQQHNGESTSSVPAGISTLSNMEREHVILSLEGALLSPDEITYPNMPKSILKAIHLTLNASYRRKVLFHYYQMIKNETQEDLTTYTSPTTANKRLYIRSKIEKLSNILVEIIRFELDLSSHCSGSMLEYLESRIFEPISMLMDITTFACAPLRLQLPTTPTTPTTTTIESTESTTKLPSSSSSKSFGWSDLMSNVKQMTTVVEEPTTSSSSKVSSNSYLPPRVLIGGFLKKNFGNFLGTTESSVENSELPEQRENLVVIQCLTTSLLAIRASSILLLERLREKSQLRKEVLLFLMKYKYYFFRLLPKEEKPNNSNSSNNNNTHNSNSKKLSKGLLLTEKLSSNKVDIRDLDLEYTSCLSFYFYQCMHDEDIELRTIAMKSWGEVFRSELSQYANQLLVVNVTNGNSNEIMLHMKIDLWKIDRGGMYLLENLAWSAGTDTSTNGMDTSITSRDETYDAFLKWLDDLPEDIRDAFETQISNTADKLRQEIMSNRTKAIRYRKEKWELFLNQRAVHSRELYDYLTQLFLVKKHEARLIQREQLIIIKNCIREWVVECTYSAALTKSLFQHSSHTTTSALTTYSVGGKSSLSSLTHLPPLLQGQYLSFSKWNDNNKDDKMDSIPFFLESSEVSPGSGEWALELSESYCRMRRKIRRGNIILVPIYLTEGESQHENMMIPKPQPLQSILSSPNMVENSVFVEPATTAVSDEHQGEVLELPQDENFDSSSSEDEEVAPSLANVTMDPVDQPDAEELEANETTGFSSLPEIPKLPQKVARKMKRMQLRQERRAHADNDPLAAFVNDMDSYSLITLPGDTLIFKCVGQQLMGMDSQKVICGISEKNYFYVFDCASSNLKPSNGNNSRDDIQLRASTIRQRQSSFSANEEISTSEVIVGNFQGGWSSIGEGESIGTRTRYWKLSSIYSVQYRRYLLLPKALEIFFLGGKSLFLRFQSPNVASSLMTQLVSQCSNNINGSLAQYLPIKSLDDGTLPPKQPLRIKDPLRSTIYSAEDGIKCCVERWVNGEMSNFEYLMHLNTFAGRTYNDWGQYPVFPWILQDYFSEELDLENPSIYRDLSKPMGALTSIRCEEAMDKFQTLQQQFETTRQYRSGPRDVNTFLSEAASRPFHYGTHYSTAAIILHYMIRLQPFTSHAVVFQGDKFDHPDRLFQSIRHSWMSSSGGISEDPSTLTSNLQDVKELIPEFFYLPDFLCNVNGYNFGITSNGVPINNIELPPWAHGSSQLFILRHRAALESEYVSRNLHKWIDLIFGYKQTGEEAVKSCNLFRYLTYGNNLDIVDLQNETQRSAFADEICSFGQTPNQLFKKRHPPRRIWNGRDISESSDVPEILSPSNSSEMLSLLSEKSRDESGIRLPRDSIPPSPHFVHLKSPQSVVGTSETLQLHLSRIPQLPISEELSSSSTKEIVSLVTSANEMLFIPRNCLMLPTKGKFHIILVYGDPEATFQVFACSTQPGTSRRSTSPTEQYSAQFEKSPLQLEPNLMLRGFESRDRTSPGSRSISIEHGAFFSDREYIDGDRQISKKLTEEAVYKTRTSRTVPQIEPEVEIWNQNWKAVSSFDFPEISVSCAAFGGVAGDKFIILTGHRSAPVVHMWAVDINAMQSAVCEVFSIPQTTIPSTVHALVLLHSFQTNVHSGGITNLSVCLKWDHLHGYSGMFASTCQSHRVVMWDYCYSEDITSIQPISHTLGGVEIYPLENSPQIQATNEEKSQCLGCVNHLVFDSVVSDLLVCIGQRVLIFDLNGRIKSVAQPSLYFKHSLLASSGALALCCQPIYCTEWESSRGFLVGYSDGSIVLWALRHYKDIPKCLWKEQTKVKKGTGNSDLAERTDLSCLTESCLTPATSFPTNLENSTQNAKKLQTSEGYLRFLLNSCATYAGTYEEWYLKSWSPASAPSYEISYHNQQNKNFIKQGTISTEYICCPVLCLHETVRENIPVTSVRLSSDWEYIIAGRGDGTVVKWKIQE